MSEAQSHSIAAIERHFHALIRERCAKLLERTELVLPSLAGLTASADEPAWFPVPGMYGGFAYHFASGREQPVLIVDSWSRVVAGSEQRHEITVEGYRLVDQW
jgi:hypothetical protein